MLHLVPGNFLTLTPILLKFLQPPWNFSYASFAIKKFLLFVSDLPKTCPPTEYFFLCLFWYQEILTLSPTFIIFSSHREIFLMLILIPGKFFPWFSTLVNFFPPPRNLSYTSPLRTQSINFHRPAYRTNLFYFLPAGNPGNLRRLWGSFTQSGISTISRTRLFRLVSGNGLDKHLSQRVAGLEVSASSILKLLRD